MGIIENLTIGPVRTEADIQNQKSRPTTTSILQTSQILLFEFLCVFRKQIVEILLHHLVLCRNMKIEIKTPMRIVQLQSHQFCIFGKAGRYFTALLLLVRHFKDGNRLMATRCSHWRTYILPDIDYFVNVTSDVCCLLSSIRPKYKFTSKCVVIPILW